MKFLFLGLLLAAVAPFVLESPVDESLADGTPRVRSFVVRSRLEYAADPSVPQLFETLYAEPDRSRWNRRVLNGRAQDRDCLFRDGETVAHLAQGSYRSVVWDEPNRSAGLLAMALRRATLTWPAGASWAQPEQQAGVTTTKAKIARSTGADAKPLGQLVATLGKDGRPTEIASFDLENQPHETLHVRRWQEHEGALWPAEMSLFVGGSRVWDERVESIESRQIEPLPAFFVPPDRREKRREKVQILPLDLLGLTLRHVELPDEIRTADDSWARALAFAADLREREAPKLADLEPPLLLNDDANFELNREGEPTHVLLRLRDPVLPAPSGWITLRDRPGVATVVHSFDDLDRSLLALLRASAPGGGQLAPAYVKVVIGSGARLQLAVHQPLSK